MKKYASLCSHLGHMSGNRDPRQTNNTGRTGGLGQKKLKDPKKQGLRLTLSLLSIPILLALRDDPDGFLRLVVSGMLQGDRNGSLKITGRTAQFQRMSFQEKEIPTGRAEVKRDGVGRSC